MNKYPILICTNKNEKTTDIVLEYIDYLGGKFYRVHKDDMIKDISINIDSNIKDDYIELKFKNKNNYTTYIKNMWYRRGDFSKILPISKFELNSNRIRKECILKEWDITKTFLHYHLPTLGNYNSEVKSNKIKDLVIARDCSLDIPETLVTTEKSKLIEFYKRNSSIITKPIDNGHLSYKDKINTYSSKGIVFIDDKLIEKLEIRFCLSLFQKYEEKEFEIRVFFIKKKLYPMAIFSQRDIKTRFDFRNYNRENPNRNVPFKFPKRIEKKILNFIHLSNLDTGSIDLIYTPDNRFVFLEVNPAGQFGWVSQNCNYYLEKEIAKLLIEQNLKNHG